MPCLFERTVRAHMTDAPMTVSPDDLLDVASSWMTLAESRHLPVVEAGKLIGVISLRDLLAAQLPSTRFSEDERWRHLHQVPVSRIVRRYPVTIASHQSIVQAAELMRTHQISCLPVVRAGDELEGILTTSDVIAFAADLMELEAQKTGAPLLVARLMTPSPIVSVRVDDRVDVISILMKHGHFRHLPVFDGHRLVGILSNRDLATALWSNLEEMPPAERLQEKARVFARDIMTSDPLTVRPEADAATAARTLLHEKIGALPVVSGDRLVGIVTETDFLAYVTACTPLCTQAEVGASS